MLNFINHYMCSPAIVARSIKEVNHWGLFFDEPPKIIFDVGANVGVYSVLLSQLYPNSEIYSFEPVPENFQALQQNLELNECHNVKTFNFGFWSEKTQLTLGIPNGRDIANTGLYSVYHSKEQETVKCEFENLDVWCRENLYPDFMKIDAEGAESEIFRHAPTTLFKLKYLLSEHISKDKNLPDPGKLAKFFREKNYKQLLDGDNILWKNQQDDLSAARKIAKNIQLQIKKQIKKLNKIEKLLENYDQLTNQKGHKESIFDHLGRKVIAKKIAEKATTDISMVVFGSPDARELSDLPAKIKQRINLCCFDIDPIQETTDKFKQDFKSFEFFQKNVFQVDFERFLGNCDIVFSRWFFHHCNTVQKQELLKTISKLLNPDGEFFLIDWFIPDWQDGNEADYLDKTLQYHACHQKYGIACNKTRLINNSKNRENADFKGGKFTSLKKIQPLLKNFDYEIESLAPNIVDDPLTFGQFLLTCKLNS